MTNLKDIFVKGRPPVHMPKPLKNWLKGMGLDSNVIELYGPAMLSEICDVYGYYIPDLHSIIIPSDIFTEGVDVDALELELGSWKRAHDYVFDYDNAISKKMIDYCHLDKPEYKAILAQDYNETDDSFYKRLYDQALRSDWKTVAKHFKSIGSKYLLWEDIWKVFQIEGYDLMRNKNFIVETEHFIIYLHLPQYDTDPDLKIIFRNYFNKDGLAIMPYAQLAEVTEKADEGLFRSDNGYKLLPLSEYSLLLYSKPIIKFDGEEYKCPPGTDGFYGSNVRFGYKFDGIYKVTSTDQSGNFVLESIH